MCINRHILSVFGMVLLASFAKETAFARTETQRPASDEKAKPDKAVQSAQISAKESPPYAAAAAEDFFPLELPVTVNNSYLGDISAEVTLSGYARVSAARLITLLSDKLSENQLLLLERYGEEPILLQQLRDEGFLAIYDPSELTIKINLPREGIEVVQVSGRSIENVDLKNVQKPAKFSAGLSLVARPRYVHASRSSDQGFAPMAADLRGFVSVGGFNNVSLSYELNYVQDRDSQIRRGDIRLIKDDFKRALRFQLGDIRPSISGNQTSINMLGFGVERNYSAIQPFRNLRPGGRTRFTIERTARASYEVNGVIIGGDVLEPGEYDIRDLPLITGANDIRVLIDDEFGIREVGSYSTFVDTGLLSAQTLLFGLNIGVERLQSRSGFSPEYSKEPIATGFIEKGLTDQLTIGVQGELSKDGGYLGTRTITGFGNSVFALEMGVSQFDNSDTGLATALRYSNRPTRNKNGRYNQLDAQISYQNASFQTIGSNGNPRGKILEISARDTFAWTRNSISLSGNWRKTDLDETTSVGVSWRRPFMGVSASLGYQGVYSKHSDQLDNRFLLTLSRNFGKYGTVRSRTATGPYESEIEWRRLSPRTIGALSGRASYKLGEQQDEISLDASYILSQGEIDIGHVTTLENGGGPVISSATSARIGLGFGFADGRVAFGRPVPNGFYILKGHPSLKKKSIEVFQSRDQVIGKTNIFGSALVPLNSGYREQTYRVHIEDLPPAYDIGSGQIKVFPSTNTGYKIQIGSEPKTLVIGVIKKANGDPVKLSVGKLIPEDTNEETIDFFTNSTGRFVAERVKPGKYKLILSPGERFITDLEINEGVEGVAQIGTITIQEN